MPDMRSLVEKLSVKSDSKIVMCVLDGLGGLPVKGKTELQSAKTPNLDRLARSASCGFHLPVARGITPGSGAAHLGLFGYDPLECEVGRGVVEAAGLGIKIGKNDLVARGNFATAGERGGKLIVTDRRAGRISTKSAAALAEKLSDGIKKAGNARVRIYPGLEHRFVAVFSFPRPVPDGGGIKDTDPQKEGAAVDLTPKTGSKKPATVAAARAAGIFGAKAREILKGEKKANCILLRGFSTPPDLSPFGKTYGLRAACVASYPMYRGVAGGILGMEVKDPEDGGIQSVVERAASVAGDFDFVYAHIKSTDRHGEDGDFKKKAAAIEEFDKTLPRLLAAKPDVLVITGDHSTPALMSSHSWHPVPLLIKSRFSIGGTRGFDEIRCRDGELGIVRSVEIMPLALAHAGRLAKFGA